MANAHGGRRPGAGRKPKDVEAYRREMERALLACVTEADWAEVTRAALERAKQGDTGARQWLSDRVMGKVREAPPSSDDLNDVQEVVFRRLSRSGGEDHA